MYVIKSKEYRVCFTVTLLKLIIKWQICERQIRHGPTHRYTKHLQRQMYVYIMAKYIMVIKNKMINLWTILDNLSSYESVCDICNFTFSIETISSDT